MLTMHSTSVISILPSLFTSAADSRNTAFGLPIIWFTTHTASAEQKAAMRTLLEQLHRRYPRALIVGHHDLNPGKACPCFDAAHEYANLQP